VDSAAAGLAARTATIYVNQEHNNNATSSLGVGITSNNDVVVGFESGKDVLDFRGSGLTLNDIREYDSPNGLHTLLSYNGNWITLDHVTTINHSTDFLFA
jgi:hypothetical protein